MTTQSDRSFRGFWTRRRPLLLTLLGVAVTLLLLAAWVGEDSIITNEEAFPEPVVLDPERRPDFVFPESVRTVDLSLNCFVDRFARVCMQGKYSDFRLMLSRVRPPILPPRFESNFNALKQVRIVQIEPYPDLPGVGPVYVMKAEYDLQDFAVRRGERTKQVHVAITKEDGEWRLGPIPHEALAQLSAYESGRSTSGPADQGPSVKMESDEDGRSRREGRTAAANQPARLTP